MPTPIERWKARWQSALLDAFIFGTLAEKPRFGGELVDLAREMLSSDIKIPTVYALLKRGVEQSLLRQMEKKEKEQITRGTPRRYYGLTDMGSQYLEEIKQMIQSTQFLFEVIGLEREQ